MDDEIEEVLEVPADERDICMSQIRRATDFLLRCTPIGDNYIRVRGPHSAFRQLLERFAN